VDVTSFDSVGSTTIFPLPSGSEGTFLLATGFDGIAGVAGSSDSTTATAAVLAAAFTGASSGSHSTTTSVGAAVRNLWSLK
jgi:hypothetical protein